MFCYISDFLLKLYSDYCEVRVCLGFIMLSESCNVIRQVSLIPAVGLSYVRRTDVV